MAYKWDINIHLEIISWHIEQFMNDEVNCIKQHLTWYQLSMIREFKGFYFPYL